MIITIWASLTGGKCVWLYDSDGEETKTIAYTNSAGEVWAKRAWPFGIRNVRLYPNGIVDDNGGNGYVVCWRYV